MAKKAKYRYGMRLRGYSIGCQPMDGLQSVYDDPNGRYHDILEYDRMLTGDEVTDYELTYLGKVEQERSARNDLERMGKLKARR